MKAQLKTDSTDLQTFEINSTTYYVKPCEGWDGYYVSTCGNIISTKGPFPLVMKQHNDRGYAKLVLKHSDRKSANLKVHRLVAQAFLEAPSRDRCGGLRSQINHIDGDKLNNKVANLEWCSAPENLSHYRLLKKVKEYLQAEAANDA
jgi:hypothetical protein